MKIKFETRKWDNGVKMGRNKRQTQVKLVQNLILHYPNCYWEEENLIISKLHSCIKHWFFIAQENSNCA